jgi:hypothetical protein
MVEVNRMIECQTADRGQGVVASENIGIGEIIFRTDEPLLAVLETGNQNSKTLQKYCYYCFAEDEDLRFCSGCKVVKYCPNNCQKASWRHTHKIECPVFNTRRAQGLTLPTPTRALMTALIQCELKKTKEAERQKKKPNLDQILALEGHEEKFRSNVATHTDFELQAKMAVVSIGQGEERLALAYSLMCRVSLVWGKTGINTMASLTQLSAKGERVPSDAARRY